MSKIIAKATAAFSAACVFAFFACSSDDSGDSPNNPPAAQTCGGKEYNADEFRCESGELVGSCRGQDYYADYQNCNGGVIEDKNQQQPQTSSSSVEGQGQPQPQQSSSSVASTGRLPCGTQTYNPAAQFCKNNLVYELCGGEQYEPANQFCNYNEVRDGWKNLDEDIWDSPSSAPWMLNNEVGSASLNSYGGMKFSAVSGSAENYYLQLYQDGHNLKRGDCYAVFLSGDAIGSGADRRIQIGFQQIGGSYTSYFSEDFQCSASGCYDSYDNNLIEGKYVYITGTDSDARFYINAGYNSARELEINALFILKLFSDADPDDCSGALEL